MDTIDNIAEGMVIEDNQGEQTEMDAAQLADSLTTEPTQTEPAHEPEKTPEQTETKPAEKTLKDIVSEGLTSLSEEGVSSEELLAFSQDETARKDIQAGKDVVRAYVAYKRREASAVKASEADAAKRSVPVVKTPTTSATGERSAIKDMSRKDFAEFSRRAEEAARMGKKVTFK